MGICYRPITACSTSPCLDCRSGYCMHYGYCEWERLPPATIYPDVGKHDTANKLPDDYKVMPAKEEARVEPLEGSISISDAFARHEQSIRADEKQKLIDAGWKSPEQVQWFKDEILELQLEIRDYLYSLE